MRTSNLDVWMREGLRLLNETLSSALNARELSILVLVVCLAITGAYRAALRALRARRGAWTACLLSTALGVLLLMAALVATRLYALPHLHGSVWRAVATAASAAGVALFLIVPLSMAVHRVNYLGGLLAVLVAAAAGAILIATLNGLVRAGHGGWAGFEKTENRTRTVNEALR